MAYNVFGLGEVPPCNFAKPALTQGQNQGQNVLDNFISTTSI
jgi:hypothetical protein